MHRNKRLHNAQHPIPMKASFLLTVHVHHPLVVALFHLVFTPEPKLMEQPLAGTLAVTMDKGKGAMTNMLTSKASAWR